MAWKNVMVTCWMVFFIIGCFLWSPHLFAVEAEKAKAGKTKKPFAVAQNKTVSANEANGAPFRVLETPGRTNFDFGYSHLFKGDYFDKVPFAPGMKDTNYGYTMVTSS